MKRCISYLALLISVIALVVSLMNAGAKNVDKVIEKWVDSNPQKVIDSLNKYVMELQQKENEERQKQSKEVLPKVKNDIMSDRTIPYAGNVNGSKVVIEFFDYNCGHCRTVSKSVDQLVSDDKDVKVILAELPIFGGSSTTAAKVALTVKKMFPSKVYEIHKALMSGNARTDEGIYEVVKSVGLDPDVIKSSIEKNSKELDATLAKIRDYAMQLGINGTPAFIIGDELIPGAIGLDQMKEYVNKK
jgi:protein-disulfide isomerase